MRLLRALHITAAIVAHAHHRPVKPTATILVLIFEFANAGVPKADSNAGDAMQTVKAQKMEGKR